LWFVVRWSHGDHFKPLSSNGQWKMKRLGLK
jgi:hypothetical protein